MFESKQKKFKKYFKIKKQPNCVYDVVSSRYTFGLASLEKFNLRIEHLTCIVRVIKRLIKKKNSLKLRVFPDFYVTNKPKDVRMGRGKGSPSHKVYPLLPGKIIVEIIDVPEYLCLLALKSCSIRLPIKTKILKKYDKRTDSIKSCW